MKKILFVANTDMHINLCYLPYIQALKKQKYIVDVATNTKEKIKYCNQVINISIRRTPFKFSNLIALFKLRKKISEEKYDLICASTPMGATIARLSAFKAKRKYGTKVIYTAHGFHFFKGAPILNYLLYYPIEKILMHVTDLLITINEEDYNFAKKHFKVDTRLIKGIGYHTDKLTHSLTKKEKIELKNRLGIDEQNYVISYIAEISLRKRQMKLVEYAKKMNLEGITILLVGGDTLNGKVEKLIKKEHLEEKIKILGFRNDINELLEITDLVISISKQEGLPLNIMEAMHKQKPILASSCRGNKDLIKDFENGLLIPVNFHNELEEKINFLRSNRELAEKLGKQNKKIVEQYSLSCILPQYISLFIEILEN